MASSKEILERNWIALHAKVQEKKIIEAFELFRKAGVEPILIKGWAIARMYPAGKFRPYTDIDLCVEPKFYEQVKILLETEKAKRLNIDLHAGLRHLDTASWQDLFDNSKLVKLEESDIRVLRAEDHLRVLCVHWLTDGGAHKEKLWDIFYGFEYDLSNFDWDRCLQTVKENRRRWIICTIGLAEKYFSVSLAGTPFEVEKIELPGWLIEVVEKEWASDIALKPLHTCLNDRKELLRQIRKRFPPNPLQATVETEGSFDNKTRVFYQIENMFARIFPSFPRIWKVLLKRRTN